MSLRIYALAACCVVQVLASSNVPHTASGGVGLAFVGSKSYHQWRGLARLGGGLADSRASPHLDRGFRTLGIQNI